MRLTIQRVEDTRVIQAERVPARIGKLAIHRWQADTGASAEGWTVTHIASGVCFGYLCCEAGAREAAMKCADLPWGICKVKRPKCGTVMTPTTKQAREMLRGAGLRLWSVECPTHKAPVRAWWFQ